MSQLLGASRHMTSFGTPDDADQRLTNMLTLYKAPASIRDMKQVYFYCQVEANTTDISPLKLQYNITDVQDRQQLYFAPIGTERQINIVDKVNDLLDIRVPKDKYVLEINLVECVIEADTSSYIRLPDRVTRTDGILFYNEPTFNYVTSYADPVGGQTPLRQLLNTTLQQATKVSEPQTLYCRIKELSNGEPYNWAITNSGAYSIDKSHQLLVRHGDINYAKLTLEFGHLVFLDRDQDYENLINDATKNIPAYTLQYGGGKGIPRLTNNKDYYRYFTYVDYNTEAFNVVTNNVIAPYQDQNYPEFYKGIGGVNFTIPDQVDVAGARNFVQPANRPPFRHVDTATPPYNLQGKPLLYNQQVGKLNFRFMVRLIHLF